jgi:hypothetical protein
MSPYVRSALALREMGPVTTGDLINNALDRLAFIQREGHQKDAKAAAEQMDLVRARATHLVGKLNG